MAFILSYRISCPWMRYNLFAGSILTAVYLMLDYFTAVHKSYIYYHPAEQAGVPHGRHVPLDAVSMIVEVGIVLLLLSALLATSAQSHLFDRAVMAFITLVLFVPLFIFAGSNLNARFHPSPWTKVHNLSRYVACYVARLHSAQLD